MSSSSSQRGEEASASPAGHRVPFVARRSQVGSAARAPRPHRLARCCGHLRPSCSVARLCHRPIALALVAPRSLFPSLFTKPQPRLIVAVRRAGEREHVRGDGRGLLGRGQSGWGGNGLSRGGCGATGTRSLYLQSARAAGERPTEMRASKAPVDATTASPRAVTLADALKRAERHRTQAEGKRRVAWRGLPACTPR